MCLQFMLLMLHLSRPSVQEVDL
ncbi:hypothetical protein LINPERPRIM_LOCUS30021 [Linum perenne]